MQSTGQASTQALSFVPIQGSAMTYAIFALSGAIVRCAVASRTKLYDADSSTRARGAASSPEMRVLPCKTRETATEGTRDQGNKNIALDSAAARRRQSRHVPISKER